MFADRCISDEGVPRLSASDAITAVPLVLYFVERIAVNMPGAEVMKPEIASMRSMCSVALAVQAVARLIYTAATRIQRARS